LPTDKPWLQDTESVREMLKKIEHLIRDRIAKFSDIKTLFEAGEFDYFFNDPIIDLTILVWKGLKDDPEGVQKTKGYLIEVSKILDGVSDESWNYEGIKALLAPYATEVGNGNVLWPLRVALSGRDKSPDPFELAAILGKETTLRRITAQLK
jgi:glutamyl/glutaminyl-tRNA synthetase